MNQRERSMEAIPRMDIIISGSLIRMDQIRALSQNQPKRIAIFPNGLPMEIKSLTNLFFRSMRKMNKTIFLISGLSIRMDLITAL